MTQGKSCFVYRLALYWLWVKFSVWNWYRATTQYMPSTNGGHSKDIKAQVVGYKDFSRHKS